MAGNLGPPTTQEFFADIDKLEKLVLDEQTVGTGKMTTKSKSAQQSFVEFVRLQQHIKNEPNSKPVAQSYKMVCDVVASNTSWRTVPRFRDVLLRKGMLDYSSLTTPMKQKLIDRLKERFARRKRKPGQEGDDAEGGGGPQFSSTLVVTTARLLKKTWETNQISKLDQSDDMYKIENQYTPAAQEFLANQNLSQKQITSFMRLMDDEAPEIPYLLTFVRRDLVNNKTPFGTYKMHKRLTLKQMELLGKKTKELDGNEKFWETYCWKLQQVHADDLIKNLPARTAYFNKLKKFVGEREQVQQCSGLRAIILYNYMTHLEVTTGKYDKSALIAYLSIPRDRGVMNYSVLPKLLQKKLPMCPPNYSIPEIPCLKPIGDDSAYVIRALSDFFRSATESYPKWVHLVDPSWVKVLYTQTRLMSKQGNEVDLKKELLKERGKYAYTDLRDMVEISICPDNKLNCEPRDRVEVDLYVKNIKELQVDVFELNALEYYKAYGKEITLDLVLDGLAPSDSRMVPMRQNDPICRARHTVKLGAIGPRSGVWLVEFVGNNQRTRCLIRKGELAYVAKNVDIVGKGRQVEILVLDEAKKAVAKPRVYVGGKMYEGKKGEAILCSYSQDHDNNTPFVIEDASKPGTATLQFTKFPRHNYRMRCGLYVDRESLLSRQQAKCIVRPALFVDDEPTSIQNLQNTKLTLTCQTVTDTITKVVSPTLTDSREYVYELTVPNELRSLEMKLEGELIKGAHEGGETMKLVNTETFRVNKVDDSKFLGDLHLIPRGASGYVLAAYGKNGEAYAGQVVKVKLDHRYFQRPLKNTLQTNEEGLVFLGRLPDVKRISAQAVGGKMFPDEHSWELLEDKVNVPTVVNVIAGDVVRIPFMSADSKGPKVDVYDTKYIQKFKNVTYKDGYVEIAKLPAGDFVAHLRDIQNIDVSIHVGEGTKFNVGGIDHVISIARVVELSEEMPLQITVVKGNRDKGYRVQLQGYNENTRVHILSTYLVPRYTSFSALASPMVRPHVADLDDLWNQYGTQQDLAEEFVYVSTRRLNLEARGKEKLGVNLPQPSMLQTATTQRAPVTHLPRPPAPAKPPAPPVSRQKARYAKNLETVLGAETLNTEDSCNLEWLAEPSCVVQNLTPDSQGWVTIPMDSVMTAQNLLQIIATDDNNISLRNVILPTTPNGNSFKDCRLNNPNNPKHHLAEIREIMIKQKGESETFENWETSHIENVDDVSDVFELFLTILGKKEYGDERMRSLFAEYHAITIWNEMTQEQRLDFYGRKKCHELNFLLWRKDNEFFKKTIVPLIRNKVQKDVVDYFLLGDKTELVQFSGPKWHTLNVFERILVEAAVPSPASQQRFDDLLAEAAGKPKSISHLDNLFRLTVESKNLARSREDILMAPIEENAKLGQEAKFDLTQVYEESRYSVIPWEETTKELLTPNDFWVDVAKYMAGGAKGPFLTTNYGSAINNVPEMLLCLAFLDLDFRVNVENLEPVKLYAGNAPAHIPGQPVKVQFRTPTILLSKQLKQRDWNASSLSVSTNYFDPWADKEVVDGEEEDKFVDPNMMETQKVYGCRVVVTNVSSQTFDVEVLTQIPQGSIPVMKGHKTYNQIVSLSPFQTTVIPYYFYFPSNGLFGHWPAHVNSNGKILGFDLKPVPLNVFDPHKIEDKESFKYHCNAAEFDDLIQFLKTDPRLPKCNLDLLAIRCKDGLKQFKEITQALRTRHLFNAEVWRHAFLYGPPCREEIEEFLNLSEDFQEAMNPCFADAMRTDAKRPLAAYDPLIRKNASYKEFWTGDCTPGKDPRHVTDRPDVKNYDSVYHNFLLTALFRSHNLLSMSPQDRLMSTYYLILMNKTAEALRVFQSIPPLKNNQLYDYMKGYLSIHATEDMMTLSKLVQKYLQSTNIGPKLRAKWEGLDAFLGELREAKAFDKEFVYESEEERAKRLEKILEIDSEIEDPTLVHKNIDSVCVKLYKIDVELMFSTAPFTKANKSYRYVEPTQVFDRELPQKTGKQKTALSTLGLKFDANSGENYIYEVTSDPFCVTGAIYLNGFIVQRSETQIRVIRRKERTPVVKAYVKVYAQTAAEPDGVFYKDGYTDLRGRFDYCTVATNALEDVEQFAILVKTISAGADVIFLEASNPCPGK